MKKLCIEISEEHFEEFINNVALGLGWTEKRVGRNQQGQPVLTNENNSVSKLDWVQNHFEGEMQKAFEKGVTVRHMRDARVRALEESNGKLPLMFKRKNTPE